MSKKGMNKKLSYIVELYSAIKKNKLLTYSKAWMNIKKQNTRHRKVCMLHESVYMKTKVK